MTTREYEGLPVVGYQPQSEEKVALVNRNKYLEEMVLRHLDMLAGTPTGTVDPRWYAIGRTAIEQGFMAINRAVFQPARADLPGERPPQPYP